MSLVWKLNRLSVMEPGEIAWRARKILGAAAERSGVLTAKTPPRASHESGVAWIATYPERFDVQTYRRAADRVLAGQFDVFALKSTPLGFPPRWNRDPKSGRDAPMTFGKLLDYRNERLVGDIKYLWEPSRHGELVTLAQAWRLTRERRYSAGCGALLNSWFDQCPYPFGPHWTSSLEHGLRLVNWAFAWQLLCGQGSSLLESDEGRVFRERWLKSVY
ncbi:MAG TPA: hypothetical protein VHK24_07405, partial [Steroidobacter sp.]|nr:hypothetical protein [Steroidobacter sp.]